VVWAGGGPGLGTGFWGGGPAARPVRCLLGTETEGGWTLDPSVVQSGPVRSTTSAAANKMIFTKIKSQLS
jgi:hypothetical protein